MDIVETGEKMEREMEMEMEMMEDTNDWGFDYCWLPKMRQACLGETISSESGA